MEDLARAHNAIVDTWADAQALGKEHPDTFDAPVDEVLEQIAGYDFATNQCYQVKICGSGSERFWVIVMYSGNEPDVYNRSFVGVVNNKLLNRSKYDIGKLVAFQGKHIYDVIRTTIKM